MPSCRPTHTHTHPPCHLAARHRSEPCPPAARHTPTRIRPATSLPDTVQSHALLPRHHAARQRSTFAARPPCSCGSPHRNANRSSSRGRTRPTAIRRGTEDSAAHSRRHTAPDTTARHLTTEQLAAHFRRHTTAAALIPRHTPSHTSAPERASAPGTHIHAGPADPHCRSAPSTHARTKKRSTLADASPLFGNVEFVTRPERNACRQLR